MALYIQFAVIHVQRSFNRGLLCLIANSSFFFFLKLVFVIQVLNVAVVTG